MRQMSSKDIVLNDGLEFLNEQGGVKSASARYVARDVVAFLANGCVLLGVAFGKAGLELRAIRQVPFEQIVIRRLPSFPSLMPSLSHPLLALIIRADKGM